MSTPTIKRAMVKLSGEALCASEGHGVDNEALKTIARELKAAFDLGTQIVLVVGGGNFVRGSQLQSDVVHRASADYMGMLATVMNAIALQEVLENSRVPARIQSSLRIDAVAEPFARRRAIRHLEKGHLLIMAGGTGKPYFTTDSGAAQGALEMGCDVLLKATKVDGVYSADPLKDPNATRYDSLTFQQVLDGHESIKVMDMAAFSLGMENNLPSVVCDLF
ncbi:MAG: UMP kinase [Planctomycetota bacterium]